MYACDVMTAALATRGVVWPSAHHEREGYMQEKEASTEAPVAATPAPQAGAALRSETRGAPPRRQMPLATILIALCVLVVVVGFVAMTLCSRISE